MRYTFSRRKHGAKVLIKANNSTSINLVSHVNTNSWTNFKSSNIYFSKIRTIISSPILEDFSFSDTLYNDPTIINMDSSVFMNKYQIKIISTKKIITI